MFDDICHAEVDVDSRDEECLLNIRSACMQKM
jgi:hypothetical protein